VLHALAYMHGMGLIHTDAKPQNILAKRGAADLEVRLGDLGCAVEAP
jgi:serine/threonine protein kinase